MTPLMVNRKQVAALLGVSEHTIERRVAAGHMPAPAKVGQLNRWSLAAIEAWIAAGCLPVVGRRLRRARLAVQA